MTLMDLPGCARDIRAVAIGGSAGASCVLREILAGLTRAFPVPIAVVQHLHTDDRGLLVENLGRAMRIPVVEVQDKMPARPGQVHVAPADYHMMVERDGAFALSVDDPVLWSRPSLDVFFLSAAKVWRSGLLAIVLSGANEDGAAGLRAVRLRGGMAVVQDPATAQFPKMPLAAMTQAGLGGGMSPGQIAVLLERLERRGRSGRSG
jgi:two-component system chemotaxis response regulator CheB